MGSKIPLYSKHIKQVDLPSIDVLNYYIQYDRDFKTLFHTKHQIAIWNCVRFRRVDILKWLYENLKISEKKRHYHFIIATLQNNVSILKFLKKVAPKTCATSAQHIMSSLLNAHATGENEVTLQYRFNIPYNLEEEDNEDLDDELDLITNLHIDTLLFWYKAHAFAHLKNHDIARILSQFASYGQIKKLQWWVDHKLPVCDIKSEVFLTEYIKSLNWLKANFSSASFANLNTIQFVDRAEEVETLKWWRRNAIHFLYTENAILNACENNDIGLLKWWAASDLELKIPDRAFTVTTDVKILEWLFVHHKFDTKKQLEYIMLNTCRDEDRQLDEKDDLALEIMKWCYRKDPGYVYSQKCIDALAGRGALDLLKWWKNNSKLPFRFSSDALDWAMREGHAHILEWWKKEGLEFKHTENGLTEAAREERRDVISWLIKEFQQTTNLLIDYDYFHDPRHSIECGASEFERINQLLVK